MVDKPIFVLATKQEIISSSTYPYIVIEFNNYIKIKCNIFKPELKQNFIPEDIFKKLN